jgi:hypothetical protein
VSRLRVAVATLIGTLLAFLLLITLEAKLSLAEERRLAAGASGLAVLAAIGLLVELTLLVNRVWSWREELRGHVRSTGPGPASVPIDAEEAHVPAERPEHRS